MLVLSPLVVLAFLKYGVTYFAKKRIGLGIASHAGPKHPNAMQHYDGICTLVTALLGWFPAILRVVGSVVYALLNVSRIDKKIGYDSSDPAHGYYLGLLQEMRLRAEFKVKRRQMAEARRNDSRYKNSWSGNPLADTRASALQRFEIQQG